MSCSAATSGCSRTGASTTRPSAEAHANAPRVAVAYSGGGDSTALLHATVAVAAALKLCVVALHVHHGLSPNADAWLAHCAARCRRWARQGRPIAFAFRRLSGRPSRGESVEAWARQARYRALAEMAREQGAELVLLGHHRRDQAETFLLQALRGGGVAGLAAMPKVVQRAGLTWARPWLDVPREQIDAYARAQRLRAVGDESNDDDAFARNRLRRRVWPALVQAFPDAEAALANAARRAQQAAAVVEAQAADDLGRVAAGSSLDLATWRDLPAARQGHVLRAWLHACTQRTPPASLVDRLLREATTPTAAQAWPIAGGELRSHRGRLFHRHLDASAPSVDEAFDVDLGRIGVHALPGWPGAVRVERVARGGVPLAIASQLRPRARATGDRFQGAANRPPRSLKLQFQAAGIAAWQRDGPILCCGDTIVFVAGLGVDARAMALPGEAQVMLHWLPHAAPASPVSGAG